MATITPPVPEARFLRGRLAALRRRLFFVSSLRGVSWLVTVVLVTAAVDGLLDWRFHLPAFIRALILVATLASTGYLALRFLFRPLAARTDDLSLALRVEESFPSLNDALASTVQFLNEPDAATIGISPSLRTEAMRRARDKINACDFNRIVDTRGLSLATLSMLGSGAIAVLLVLFFPALALTAMVRLAIPFGAHDWPAQTRLQALTAGPFDGQVALIGDDMAAIPEGAALRVGRGQAFIVRGKLVRGNLENGIVPKRAVVLVHTEGGTPSEHSCEVVTDDKNTGHFETRLDTSQLARGFKFRIVAHDAPCKEYEVLVQQPPVLLPLDGKPSPQLVLDFPAYTGLPSPLALPPGIGDVEAVNGTAITLRGRADRPLYRAWIEYQPELKTAAMSAFLAPLGAANPAGVVALTAAGVTSFDVVPAQLGSDRTQFTVRFVPLFTGMYVLHFEDDTHLRNSRPFALRLHPDPAPTVQLERPSPSQDVLTVLPEAELPVQVIADDTIFAVRSVLLSYRTKRNDPPRYLVLYDPDVSLRRMVASLTGSAMVQSSSLRVRPTHLDCRHKLALATLKHLDGSPLQEGDVITLQASADDFDDVSVNKQPGRSAEVDIRIISRNAFDLFMVQEQTRIQQDLLRQRDKEREAMNKVQDAENRLKKGEKLTAEDRTQLLQAEQLQQQIRERVGNEKEGLRAEVQRVLQTIEQNGLQNSAVRERLRDVGRELQRLAERELEPIEPRLADVRTLAELMEEQSGEAYRARMDRQAKQTADKARANEKDALDKRAAADKAEELAEKSKDDAEKKQLLAEAQRSRQQAEQLAQKARELDQQAAAERRAMDKPDLKAPQKQLADARRGQEEVERTLSDLLDRLEPWASSREIKGEAGRILEEQRKLHAELEELEKKGFLGKDPQQLDPTEKAELENLRDAEQRLAERTNKLLDKMKRFAEERGDKDPETAKTIDDARQQAVEANVAGKMRQAREEIGRNQLEKADKTQQAAAKEMQKMVKTMEDRRADELERLIKKMKETEHELAQLADEQEKLQQKMKEAGKIADPAQREEELKKLTAQQRKLQEKTEEMAKLLTRLRNKEAESAVSRAGGAMDQAGQQLRQGGNPEQKQEDVLQRLDEAQRAVEKARKRAEEELLREQLTRVADALKRLRDRQAAMTTEGTRVQTEAVKRKAWDRGLRGSLEALGRTQTDLGTETAEGSKKELESTPVFAKQVERAAEAMKHAGNRFNEMYDDVKKKAADNEPLDVDALPDEQATRAQKDALHRLDQLLEALKSETEALAKRAAASGENGGGDGDSGAEDTGLPPLAQIKLLKAMQTEVNQAIDAFQKKHADLDKLDDKEKAEFQAIQQDQRDVLKLLEVLRNVDGETDK